MTLADQRLKPPGSLGVGPVAAARADRLDRRRTERMALFGAAQCAGGEHPDIDDAHIGGLGMRQQIAEIMRRIARRDRRAGARVE